MTSPDDPSRIQNQPLALEPLLAWHAFPDCGGLAMFAGTVRDHHDEKSVLSLTYTAYAPLAEKQIREIERAVSSKHGAPYVRVLHRVGPLSIGERSEEHTSELQSLMRISYAVFCLKKKKKKVRDITSRQLNSGRHQNYSN